MKNTRIIIITTMFLFFISQLSYSQNSKTTKEIKFLTSAHCGVGKQKVETALNKTNGVTIASLDIKSQIVTIKYETKKITAAKLKSTIKKSGFTAKVVKNKKTTRGCGKSRKCGGINKCKS